MSDHSSDARWLLAIAQRFLDLGSCMNIDDRPRTTDEWIAVSLPRLIALEGADNWTSAIGRCEIISKEFDRRRAADLPAPTIAEIDALFGRMPKHEERESHI